MSLDISILLDQSSIAALGRIKGASARLDAELEKALDGTAADLEAAIPANMNWQNPSGALAGSFSTTSTTLQREIGSELPYSRRRDRGFVGADSLGRVYNDVGAFYAQSAIEQVAGGNMLDRFDQGLDNALAP